VNAPASPAPATIPSRTTIRGGGPRLADPANTSAIAPAASFSTRVTPSAATVVPERSRASRSTSPPTVSSPRVPPASQNAVTAAEAKASTAATMAATRSLTAPMVRASRGRAHRPGAAAAQRASANCTVVRDESPPNLYA
jgi:hypothetical protein